jgi:hypothetical protein
MRKASWLTQLDGFFMRALYWFMIKSNVYLLIKDKQGNWKPNLDFPAVGYNLLKTKSKGFPDLTFGLPGFCRPVWRWNVNEYTHLKNIPEKKGGCK